MENEEFEIEKTVLYIGEEGSASIECIVGNETLWANQKSMSELFGVAEHTITYHLKNIFDSNELNENSTTRKIRVVQNEGNRKVKREVNFYNLDVMISLGYRVNSKKATNFRIWATNILKEYIIKGFVLDEELLKNGQRFTKDYFNELLIKIREIRSSERRFYQKITDIYSTSYDYTSQAKLTKDFFSKVQNKLHFAVTQRTVDELINEMADNEKVNMGLTNWKDSPNGKILPTDIKIAKNYLNESELKTLNKLVESFLNIAELRARREIPMGMED